MRLLIRSAALVGLCCWIVQGAPMRKSPKMASLPKLADLDLLTPTTSPRFLGGSPRGAPLSSPPGSPNFQPTTPVGVHPGFTEGVSPTSQSNSPPGSAEGSSGGSPHAMPSGHPSREYFVADPNLSPQPLFRGPSFHPFRIFRYDDWSAGILMLSAPLEPDEYWVASVTSDGVIDHLEARLSIGTSANDSNILLAAIQPFNRGAAMEVPIPQLSADRWEQATLTIWGVLDPGTHNAYLSLWKGNQLPVVPRYGEVLNTQAEEPPVDPQAGEPDAFELGPGETAEADTESLLPTSERMDFIQEYVDFYKASTGIDLASGAEGEPPDGETEAALYGVVDDIDAWMSDGAFDDVPPDPSWLEVGNPPD